MKRWKDGQMHRWMERIDGWKGQIDRKDGRKEMIDGYKVYIWKGQMDRWIERIK